MKKILVAGASGYLGQHITAELVSRRIPTRALVRQPDRLSLPPSASLEVVQAEATQRETLHGVMQDIDTVISALGITRQRDGLTYNDVDFQANLNLLEAAQRAGVRKFIYVSVLQGDAMRDLAICAAKENFVDELKQAGMQYTVIRPNGFFSDMGAFIDMARRGRVFVFADGQHRSNPIHGADLAKVCVAAIDGADHEIPVGGPDVLSQRQIAELAFAAVARPPRVTGIPDVLRRLALTVVRAVTPLRIYGPFEFFMTVAARDMVAPATGSEHLADYFAALAQDTQSAGDSS